MEKRLVLAIALSMLVLLIWSGLAPKTQPIVTQNVTTINQPSVIISPTSEKTSLAPAGFPSSPLRKVSQDKFDLYFSEPQAALKEVVFKDHLQDKFVLQRGFFLTEPGLVFQQESSSLNSLTFICQAPGQKIKKKFTFSDYTVELEIEVENLSQLTQKINFALIAGVLDLGLTNPSARYQDFLVATKDQIGHFNGRKELVFPEIKFVGLRDRYFCMIVEPRLDNYSAFLQKLNLHQSELGLNFPEKTLGPRQFLRQIYRIYLGPQELQIINRINPEWSAIIYYGTFDFIAQLLVQALEFFYRLAHNWGWAIIFLSLAIYLLLYPLTLKQLRSMKEMQALQPRMEEIRRAYKDNPQKLNSEIMKLYREHKVNPLGGCLPLILQLPVFFALYQALLRASFLRGASFLWIKDLTEPDRLFLLPANLPVHEVNILPILMAITMFIQQKLSLTAATDSVAEQQKMMLVIMPLMFGFIFYNMPAGLVLYWFVNSTLMLMNQLRLKRAK